jgi:hypothetical protein
MKYPTLQDVINYCKTTLTVATAETIAWIGISIMSGLSDKMPPVDLILFMWAGLSMLFVRAVILKDILHIVTIGLGFIIHSVLLALILFK